MGTLLRSDELCAALKIHETTLARWRKAGIVPAIKIGRQTFRFDECEVVKALRARSAPSARRAKTSRPRRKLVRR